MAMNPTHAANIAHNATRFGAIPQVQSPTGAPAAAFPGSPLNAGGPPHPAFAGAPRGFPQGPQPGSPLGAYGPAGSPLTAGVPPNAAAFAGAPRGFPQGQLAGAPLGVYGPAGLAAPAGFAPAAYAQAAYGGAAIHPSVVAPTYAGAVAAGAPVFGNALVPAVGAQLVDDWSAAYGYGFPSSYGYGSLPATATVAVGGAAGLYDSRLIGTAAANPALYAASYGAPLGGYAAPSYVPAAVQGVPTFSALAGPNFAASPVGYNAAYAPNYYNAAGLNTFAPTYFGGFPGQYAGQFAAPAAYY